MKESFTINNNFLNEINTDSDEDGRTTSYVRHDNIFQNDSQKKSNNEFTITSITPTKTTINKTLEISTNYNDDIFIFEIKGKTKSNSEMSWKIYKNHHEIKDLFEKIRKELNKKNKDNKDNKYMLKICKIIKDYTNGEITDNIKTISIYIMNFYNSEEGNKLEILNEALRISAVSFVNNYEIKPLEGYAFKKADPRILRSILKYICFPLEYWFFKGWNKRWIVLKDDMICYLNSPKILVGKNVYWFDEETEIIEEGEKELEIRYESKKGITLKFNSRFERDLWKKEIEERIEKITDQITNNIYSSYTSLKTNCGAKWFIDGENYFRYLLEQLKNAKESVFITDWFMSPELALKRPINYNDFVDKNNDYRKKLLFSNVSRLMDIFYLLAKKGVKIYILLYSEVTLALAINSAYTKVTLKSLHENIFVTRHPKKNISKLWSHHEKLVIIDQKIAFVGGLDLCWGRYDSNKHPIVEEENETDTYYYPGCDYINERQVDLHNVEKFYEEQLDRNSMPRMAWHDVHTMVEGPIVSDIVRHFVERWNFARYSRRNNGLVNVSTSFSYSESKDNFNIKDDKKNKNKKKDKNKSKNKNKNIHIELKDSINLSKMPSKTLNAKNQLLIEKIAYNNFEDIKEEENDDDDNEDNEFFINNNINDSNISNSYNNNIIPENPLPLYERNSSVELLTNKDEKKRFTLFSNVKEKVKEKVKDKLNKFNDYKKEHGKKEKKMKLKQKAFLSEDDQLKDQSIDMDFNIQALRSVCEWSIGKKQTERSILQGYYKLIDNAKHYIYIENQFFITKSFSEVERADSGLNLNSIVWNEIGLHIRARIERAYEEKSNFKVFICIPLLPGFSGTPGESSTMNGVLKHTFQSIAHNKGMSLLEQLKKKLGSDVYKYIYFYSLRNHGTIKGIPVTELIYIHSKLMIIDDEKVLIGSANINDRSMKGSRDSEFAIIIEEQNKINSIMDGKNYMASNYAKSLRKNLMAEHLGKDVNDKILDDPLNEDLWTYIHSQAKVNAAIYSDIFDCFPDNKFKTFADLKKRKIIKTEEDIEELKTKYKQSILGVIGHIVEYPIKFLQDEELDIDFFSKENLVPEKNFT